MLSNYEMVGKNAIEQNKERYMVYEIKDKKKTDTSVIFAQHLLTGQWYVFSDLTTLGEWVPIKRDRVFYKDLIDFIEWSEKIDVVQVL